MIFPDILKNVATISTFRNIPILKKRFSYERFFGQSTINNGQYYTRSLDETKGNILVVSKMIAIVWWSCVKKINCVRRETQLVYNDEE